MSEKSTHGAPQAKPALKPTHYHAEYNTTVWPHPLYPCACDKTNARSFLATCPRCRPDLWREISPATAVAPEPQCVWWVNYVDESRWRKWHCEGRPANGLLNSSDLKFHFGPRPPCEDHSLEIKLNYKSCSRCHASLSSENLPTKSALDVGASELNAPTSDSSSGAGKSEHLSVPKPLHQDPLRFRGHLRGCHAWRYEDYNRCGCATVFDGSGDPGRRESVSLPALQTWPTDWDL